MSEDKAKLLSLIVKDIFNGVTLDEILVIDSLGVRIGDTLLPIQDIEQLKTEVKYLRTSYLWRLIVKRIQYLAQSKACNSAKSFDDVVFGQAMIYNLQKFDEVFDTIEKIPVIKAEKSLKKSKSVV